jgi:hypothetical protein
MLSLILGEVAFDVQPKGQDICLADDLVLTANATITGGTQPIDYQWYFKGLQLSNNARISGSNTGTLKISNVGPDDEGNYSCEATSTEFSKTAFSNDAAVVVNYPPVIETQPTDQTLKEGEDLELSVEATSIRPMTYQWFKDDVKIDGATTPDFEIQGVTLTHNGFYFCNVTNDCGTMKTTVVQVVVNKDGGISGVTEENAIKLQVTPNPAISDINISFTLENEAQVEIAILDLTGKKVASKLSGANAGDNNLTMTLGENIASGTYFVQVTYNGSTYSRQIVVKK